MSIPIFLFTGALGKELGWRGLLLDKLLDKYNYIVASVIVGVIWNLYHMPLWFSKEFGYSSLSFIVFTVSLISISFYYSFLYIYTRKSLFVNVEKN